MNTKSANKGIRKYVIPCRECGHLEGRVEYEEYLCRFCRDVTRPPHDWGKTKKRLFSMRGKRCQICKRDSVQLCVHHIDMNRRNNEYENLQILCQQCHKSRHQNMGKQLLGVFYGSCGAKARWA